MGKIWCSLCSLSCTSVRSLCEHVLGGKHKALLTRSGSAELKELGRVQYFLDTYLKEETIVGLEHVVEKKEGSTYLYTCQLCNVVHDWRKMVCHVVSTEHTESFMYKHHSDLISAFSFFDREEQLQALEEAVKSVCADKERTKIRDHNSPADSTADVTGLSDESCGVVVDTADDQSFDCNVCNISTGSAVALCEHILGSKHKRNLQRKAPRQLKDLGKLSYFLHNHLKDDPILGLEYIVEISTGISHKYTCQLCEVDTDLLKMVIHMTDADHMENYVKKHHADLLPPASKFSKRLVVLKTLKELAVKIVESHGKKEIQFKKDIAAEDANLRPPTIKPLMAFKSSRVREPVPQKPSSASIFRAPKRPLPHENMEPYESFDSYLFQNKKPYESFDSYLFQNKKPYESFDSYLYQNKKPHESFDSYLYQAKRPYDRFESYRDRDMDPYERFEDFQDQDLRTNEGFNSIDDLDMRPYEDDFDSYRDLDMRSSDMRSSYKGFESYPLQKMPRRF